MELDRADAVLPGAEEKRRTQSFRSSASARVWRIVVAGSRPLALNVATAQLADGGLDPEPSTAALRRSRRS